MDQYFRWPGNAGFNASIRRVEDILKAAGYVEESKAKKGDVADVSHRAPARFSQPAWEPVDASVTIVGEVEAGARSSRRIATCWRSLVLDARHRRRRAARRRREGNARPTTTRRRSPARSCSPDGGDRPRVRRGRAEARRARRARVQHAGVHAARRRIARRSSSAPSRTTRVKKSWGMPISRDAVERLRAALAKGPVKVRVQDEDEDVSVGRAHARRRSARQRGAERAVRRQRARAGAGRERQRVAASAT